MKEIIKNGTKQTATCKNCGCTFSFEAEDIVTENVTVAGIPTRKSYVVCPQCNFGHILEQTR